MCTVSCKKFKFPSLENLRAIWTHIGEHFPLHDSGIGVTALPPDLPGGRVRRHPRFVPGILLHVALGWGTVSHREHGKDGN